MGARIKQERHAKLRREAHGSAFKALLARGSFVLGLVFPRSPSSGSSGFRVRARSRRLVGRASRTRAASTSTSARSAPARSPSSRTPRRPVGPPRRGGRRARTGPAPVRVLEGTHCDAKSRGPAPCVACRCRSVIELCGGYGAGSACLVSLRCCFRLRSNSAFPRMIAIGYNTQAMSTLRSCRTRHSGSGLPQKFYTGRGPSCASESSPGATHQKTPALFASRLVVHVPPVPLSAQHLAEWRQ